jgi:hypothetical protein
MAQPAGTAAEGWKPAHQAEALMVRALLVDDATEFFRQVVAHPLYVPIEPAGSPDGRAGKPVMWDLADTYLLAFTSRSGMVRCFGTEPQHTLLLTYDELLQTWPDPHVRLLLNPASPIDAALAIGEVGAAARGEQSISMNQVEVPTGPGPNNAPTSPPRGGGRADPLGFAPADETEQALLDARTDQDVAYAMTALVTASVLLTTTRPVDVPADFDADDFPWAVTNGAGIPPYLTVFTSPMRLVDGGVQPGSPLVRIELLSLLMAWPDQGLQLVVNPGSAIEFTVDGLQVPILLAYAAKLYGDFADEPDEA